MGKESNKAADNVSLRDYFEAIIARQDDAVKSALAAADRATNKAETAVEKRFDSVNEFRQALNDQTKTLLPRIEFDGLGKQVVTISDRLKELEGANSGKVQTWVWIFAAASLVVGIAGFVIAMYALMVRK